MTRIYFVGIGTVVNTGAIVIGGLLGYLFQRLLSEKLQQTLMQAIGVAVMFIGISGTLSRMLVIQHDQISTQGIMMATVSLAIGAILGELIDIEAKFDRLGRWLRQRVGQGNDSKFIDGFVSAFDHLRYAALPAYRQNKCADQQRLCLNARRQLFHAGINMLNFSQHAQYHVFHSVRSG